MDRTPRGKSSRMICSIFVYGTLQTTGCRAKAWPHPPLRIAPARVRGQLFDLGPYPALRPGSDWITGERWEFSPDTIDETLQVLDAIEGFAQGDDDLYRREAVPCWDHDDTQQVAFTYFYAQSLDTAHATRIHPDASDLCRWDTRHQPGDELL